VYKDTKPFLKNRMFTENFISTRLVKGEERVRIRIRKPRGLPYIIMV
jgi:hypothetical protein